MIEMMDIEIDNAIAFQMSGKITESDMSLVLNAGKKRFNVTAVLCFLKKLILLKALNSLR